MIKTQYQHAFYAHNEVQVAEIKDQLGLAEAEWIEDIVVGEVSLRDRPFRHESVARLRFCYSFPVEIEILTYIHGPHWHETKDAYKQGRPFVSHIGFHMEEGEASPIRRKGQDPTQLMWTKSHSNPYLIEKGRTFRYEILSQDHCPSPIGVDLKYIWRKEPK